MARNQSNSLHFVHQKLKYRKWSGDGLTNRKHICHIWQPEEKGPVISFSLLQFDINNNFHKTEWT